MHHLPLPPVGSVSDLSSPIILLFFHLIPLTSHFFVFDSCLWFDDVRLDLCFQVRTKNLALRLDGLVLTLARKLKYFTEVWGQYQSGEEEPEEGT